MNSEQYIENILQATSILTQQAIKNANFDKTIQAVIIQCTDPTIGKYKVQYQDGYWYAYSGSTQVSYSFGSNVYILVPNGDMSKDKTILGTTKKLGINYINVISQKQNYIPVGCNVITESIQYNLCSFQDEVVTLYDISNISENLLTIDADALKTYVSSSSNLLLSMDVKTVLPLKQRYNGNYGLRAYIDFKDNNTQSLITRRYDLDIDNMIGNPYELSNKINQIRICDIDSQNFERINKIEIFVQDFPLQESGHSDDIFLSNFNITGAIALTSQERNGVSLNLIAKQGYIFTSSSLATDTRQIEAQVRVRTKAIDNSSQRLPFYWFIEDARITPNNMYYNQWGGRGWKCLNDYKVIQQASTNSEAIIQFNSTNEFFNIAKQDTFVRTTKYKCVVIYNDTVFSKQFEIINEDCDYSIQIISDEGTQFAYDIGHPNLQCVVKNEGQIQDPEYYDFIWGTVDNAGNFNSLPETTALNNDYNQALEDYEDFRNDLINENIYWQGSYNATITNEQHLEDLYAVAQAMERMQRVSANFVYSVDIGQIIKFKTFKCTIVVKTTGIIVGTASITLVNSLSANNMYTLIINNGTQVFNYTESGVAPTNNSLDNPYEIPQLAFTVYDNKGKAVEQEFNYDEIEWIVPVQNTMLNIDDNYDGELNEDETKMIYKNYKVFNYNILNQYFANKTQNNIQLKVSYNGLTLVAYTNLNFIKQGNSGTNGTDFQVRIVPNIASGYSQLADYPMVTIPYGGQPTTNWTHVDGTHNGRWFKVQLWHNGNKIFSGNQATSSTRTQEDKPIEITWSVLKNKYTYSNSDVSCLTINQDTGSIVYNDSNLLSIPANIIKATVIYDGLTYYANIPIITVKQLNSGAVPYYAKLKKNTGFRQVIYKSSGTKPSYDNHNPFEIVLTKNLSNGTYEDISVNTVLDPPTYTWSYVGEYYNKVTNQFVVLSHLMTATNITQPTINQKWIKPTDNYDGQVINNAVIVNIAIAGTDRVLVHIPVHLMLNRYEQSALNGWDGNNVQLGGANGGIILSPQIGAGIKQMDNSFTGMVMGKVKDSSSTDIDMEVGLFGYDHGERTIFLDADTGKAQFGKNNSGKIIIDPRNSQAVIQSGNYSPGSGTTPGQGMQINLTTPSINFGSGNFSVDQYGHVTLKGATLTGNSTTIENLDSLLANSQTIADLQEQIQDGIQVWSGTDVPTLNNYPANQWSTIQDKRNHVGNLYFQSDGDYYRFVQTSTNVFEWILIPDSGAQALQTANDAFQRVTEIYDADTASGLLVTDYYTKNQTDTQLNVVEGRINNTMSSNYTSKAQFKSSRYDNLLPYPYEETTHVDNNITWTDNGDGTITANGTALADSNFYLTKSIANYDFRTDGEVYTISTGVSGTSSSTYFVMGFAGNTANDGKYFNNLTINGTSAYDSSYTVDTAGYAKFGRFYIRIKSGVTVSNLTFKPMLEKGTVAHDYISYADSIGGVQASVKTTDNKVSTLEQTVEVFQTTVSETYSTKTEALGYASTAQSNAISTAASDATSKANAAQSAAEATAAADATSKANAAQAAAEATASADATSKANAAENNAKGYTDTQLISYSTTTEMNSAITQKANEITQTVSETYTTIAQTSIVNLLPSVYRRETQSGNPWTSNGVTFTVNDDGSVTCTGTATDDTSYYFCGVSLDLDVPVLMVETDKRYILHGCPSGGSISTYCLRMRVTGENETPSLSTGTVLSDIGNGRATSEAYRYIAPYIFIKSGYALPTNGLTYYPMLEVGTERHGYISSRNGVGALTKRVSTAESSITQNANNIASKVSWSDYTGETVASLINQSADTVLINAGHIDLAGSVAITDFDSAAKAALVTDTTAKNQYYISTSDTSTTGGSWSDSISSWTAGKYIWTRVATTNTYANSTSSTQYSTAVYDKNLTDAMSNMPAVNLLPSPYQREYLSGNTYVYHGVTWTLNADGSVTATGATSSDTSTYFLCAYTLDENIPVLTLSTNKRYTVSGCPAGGSTSTYQIRVRYTASGDTPSSSSGSVVYESGDGRTTATAWKYACVYLWVAANYTLPTGGVTFYPMFEVGTTKHDYVSSHNGVWGLTSNAIKSTVSCYYRSTSSTKPTISESTTIGTALDTSNAWEYPMPRPKRGCYFFTCERYTFADGSIGFSEVRQLGNLTYSSMWCSANDATCIDGGAIYANSVTADKINVSDLYALNANIADFQIDSQQIVRQSSTTLSNGTLQAYLRAYNYDNAGDATRAFGVEKYNGTSWVPSFYVTYGGQVYSDGTFVLNNIYLPRIRHGTTSALTIGKRVTYDINMTYGKDINNANFVFNSAPTVVAGFMTSENDVQLGQATVSVLNITTSGFTIRISNYSDVSDVSTQINWIAVESV